MELRDRPLRAIQGSTERGEGNSQPKPGRFRPYRNGLPEIPYEYRRRTYPWAQRAIAAAEARYGKPRPVCERCGAPLPGHSLRRWERCVTCAAA